MSAVIASSASVSPEVAVSTGEYYADALAFWDDANLPSLDGILESLAEVALFTKLLGIPWDFAWNSKE